MVNHIKLNSTPIKEIIFTISIKESIEVSKLDSFRLNPQISIKFPSITQGFNTEINAKKSGSVITNVSTNGFMLKSGNPINKILQAMRGTFSFHKVNGYESFDSLLTEFNGYWTIFKSYVGPINISSIDVRYLNFIKLNDNENQEDLITIKVSHPFGEKVKNSYVQQKFNYSPSNRVRATVVSTRGRMDGSDGIILDIMLNKTIDGLEVENLDGLNVFNEMREIKNDIFFKCITEKTISKYIL